jgi:UDP-2-acetamido-2-deoxy-ribo-hexuluronate aminotransferase
MDQIRMVDLKTQYLKIKTEIDAAIADVLNETLFIDGPQVTEFANALGKYVGSPFVIPCANGTDALQIAMMALDLKPGDEVIVPVHTYVATAEVISLLGLNLKFADVDPHTFNLSCESVKKVITSRTKVIVPVHLYGQCADMDPLLNLAKQYGLYVVEDAAQALGAVYVNNQGASYSAGTMGIIGITSFFPSKNLGCYGDGGALFTADEALAGKMKSIANHGQKRKYYHDLVGVNSRLDTLQAAILNVKFRYLDQYTEARRQVAAYYDRNLVQVPWVEVPFRAQYSSHVFHQYTLKVERRDMVKDFLAQSGIPSMIYYPLPLHLQKAYINKQFPEGSFPISEQLSKSVLSLPIHTEMTTGQLELIVKTIKQI